MPGRRERPGLRFAVADDARDDQLGVVERRAEGMAQRIAELAAFVDRSRASPATRGWGCRREMRTAGTASAARLRPG